MKSSDYFTRSVLYVGSSLLFDDCLARLLSYREDLQVMRTKYRNDEVFLDEVRQKQPDVMLVNEGGTLDKNHLLKLINANPALASLRIIMVRMGNNVIDIYDGSKMAQSPTGKPKSMLLKTSEDLINAVSGGQGAKILLAGIPL